MPTAGIGGRKMQERTLMPKRWEKDARPWWSHLQRTCSEKKNKVWGDGEPEKGPTIGIQWTLRKDTV